MVSIVIDDFNAIMKPTILEPFFCFVNFFWLMDDG